MTEAKSRPKFSAEMWAAFWAAPAESRIGDILADDIVGYWQGDPKPVRGREAYTAEISAPGEQLVFLHYVGSGTGPDGPFAMRGLDRVRTRDGMVIENVIRYDQVEP